MLKQLIVFAYRGLRKTHLMNLLNISGLMLGLSVFFLVSLFIYQERSYEYDWSGSEDMYQVGTYFYTAGSMSWTSTNLPHVLHEIPEIQKHTIFTNREKSRLYLDGEERGEFRVINSDANFLDVFDFELTYGDPATVLDEPYQAVVSEETAMRLFGRLDVIDEVVNISKEQSVVIKGVSKAPHYQTQMKFDLLASKPTSKGIQDGMWGSIGSFLYVVTTPGTDVKVLNEKLENISRKHLFSIYNQTGDRTFDEWRASDSYIGFFAESIETLRTDTETQNNMMPKMDESRINTMMVVGLAALILSIINFINLSTARASARMREVAVKRILGSSRRWLITQFMLETFVVVLTATLLALGFVEALVILKPAFLGGLIEYSVLHNSQFVVAIICFLAGLTLISGLYPALYLSSGNVVVIMRKGGAKGSFSFFNAALLRKGALVLQFVFSLGLIATVTTMFLQVDHLDSRDIGYDPTEVFVMTNPWQLNDQQTAFVNELNRLPSVVAASYSNLLPSDNAIELPRIIKDADEKEHYFSIYSTDPEFLEVMNMRLTQGEVFPKFIVPDTVRRVDRATGMSPVLINEAGVKQLGLTEPLGAILSNRYEVVGVIDDFVFKDLRSSIGPIMIIHRNSSQFYKLAIRLQPGTEAVEDIEAVWARFTNQKMRGYQLSNNYERLMEVERSSFNAVFAFCLLAIIVSCIGLLGLAVFLVDQRMHEFGIRKVLGASLVDIVKLFSLGFIKLIGVALIVTVPLTIYALNLWLDNFADRISLSPAIYLFTVFVMCLIVFGTVSFQSVKAGKLNPVDTLRSE